MDEVTGVVGGETGGVEEAPDDRGMGHGMDGDVGTNSHSPEEVLQGVSEQENEAATSYTDRPRRIRKPNVKYSAAEYDLCSIRMKSKKHKMKPM